ncbi:proton-coupled folate transporter-like [Aricia agestis]|uniref:proton-coupled folate transporter-like n=1 Tax=Aricia agestis TaxID=91739 RepID=UPI001C20A647|nr:proton-coupled folate transporter-like [Aricia agestis]XP_041984975.1 proton-coupled folate transporter-like [Aricia agestis]
MADREQARSALTKRSMNTTIELPILMNIIAINVAGSALSNVILYRTCLHSLNHTHEECKPFLSPIKSNATQWLEKDVQAYAAFVITVKTVLEYIGPAILSLFLGVWSDTYGRKPLLVWPIFGLSITSLLHVVYSVTDALGPWWFIATVVPFSFSGGFVVLFTGAYCYVSDISTPENTSLRMTILDATTVLGSFFGSLISSYLILAFGNVNLLLLAASFNVLAYAFTHICIVESLVGALQGGVTRVLDLLLVKEMIGECFKKRPNFGRAQIILITLVKFLSIVMMCGTGMLEYLFTRNVLNWDLQEYTVYSSVSTLVAFFGGFLGIIVVQKLFRMGDIMFSIVAILTSAGEYFIKMNAKNAFDMYISCFVSMFKNLSGPLTRSYMTKLLPLEDIAKVFAFMCTVESLAPIITPVVYNSLYSVTVSSFPGSIYLLSAMLATFSAILLAVVFGFSWKNSSLPTYERIINAQSQEDIAGA